MANAENRASIERWNSGHALGMISASLFALYIQSLLYLIVVALVSFSSFIWQNRATLKSLRPYAGYANWVTSTRLLLLVTLFIVEVPFFLFVSGLVLVVCLDGVDGWMARKFNHSTLFGQYFDMELDALFVLLMCCWYYLFEEVGFWILVPGLLRYFYKLGIDLFPKNEFKERKKTYASTIAGIFFVSLLFGLILENSLRQVNLAIGSALIVFSFSVSTIEYIKFQNVTNTIETG